MSETATMEMPPGLVAIARAWWLLLVVGVMCIAAGIIVLVQPDISLVTLAVVTGVFMVVDGVFDVLSSLPRAAEHRGMVALLGILTVVVGLVLINHPVTGVLAVALLIGIWLIAFGMVRLFDAFATEGHGAWSVIAAIVEVIAGIVILAAPEIGVATLAILVGIAFILRGMAMCAIAWGLRTAKQIVTA